MRNILEREITYMTVTRYSARSGSSHLCSLRHILVWLCQKCGKIRDDRYTPSGNNLNMIDTTFRAIRLMKVHHIFIDMPKAQTRNIHRPPSSHRTSTLITDKKTSGLCACRNISKLYIRDLLRTISAISVVARVVLAGCVRKIYTNSLMLID